VNRRHVLRIEESPPPSFESFGLTADKLKELGVRSQSSGYCGGDLPTRLVTRG